MSTITMIEIEKMEKLYNEAKSSYSEEEKLYGLDVLNMYKKTYEIEQKQKEYNIAWAKMNEKEIKKENSIRTKERYHSTKAKESREKNKEKLKEKRREYYKKNKDKINKRRIENRMKKANNTDSETESDDNSNDSDYCPIDMYC